VCRCPSAKTAQVQTGHLIGCIPQPTSYTRSSVVASSLPLNFSGHTARRGDETTAVVGEGRGHVQSWQAHRTFAYNKQAGLGLFPRLHSKGVRSTAGASPIRKKAGGGDTLVLVGSGSATDLTQTALRGLRMAGRSGMHVAPRSTGFLVQCLPMHSGMGSPLGMKTKIYCLLTSPCSAAGNAEAALRRRVVVNGLVALRQLSSRVRSVGSRQDEAPSEP
jgi:hypothetical protein